jgi:hypothetical protein
MRKLISLGILALLLSMLASPVSAGDKGICMELKDDSKGLYGLCVAYQNTEDGSAKEKIMGNFTRRARNGETMPIVVDPKKPEIVACPCWNNEDLLRATCTATYDDHWFSDDGINADVVFYNGYTIQFDADHVIDPAGDTVTTCSLNVLGDGYVASHNFTSPAENFECRAGLRVLVNEDLLDLCP